MANRPSRLILSIPKASPDGRFYGPWPNGNAPLIAGAASGLVSASGTLLTSSVAGPPTPYYTKWAIGDSTIDTFRYANSTFINFAKTLFVVVLNYLPSTDQSAAMTRAQIDQAISSSPIGTKPIHYTNSWYQFAADNRANLNTAETSGNWLVRSTFPSGSVLAGGQTGSTVLNMNPGGPTFGGRTMLQYFPLFLIDDHVLGGALGISGGVLVPNPFCAGFLLDDMQPFAPGDSHGDILRLGTLTGQDFTYTSSTDPSNPPNVAKAIQTGFVQLINALKSNQAGTFLVGGNGGGSPSNITLPVPTSYLGLCNHIPFENAFGGGHGCIGNPGNGGNFTSLLKAYQIKQSTVDPGGTLGVNVANIRADGSIMQSYQVSTNGPPVYSPAWQGVRGAWGWVNVCGIGGLDADGTDPNNDSGNGSPHSSSILRYFDWYFVNTVTGAAISQANAALGQGNNWIGGWIDPPQTVKWLAQGPLGIWRRQGTNADVYYNPYGNGVQTVTLPRTYRKITSAQDPTMNGGTTNTVTLQDGGCGDCFIGLK